MMQIDGKTRYTLKEAAEQTGYSKNTIMSYIYAGTVDGDKMDDGQWFVSETGIVQLRRKKNAIKHNPPSHPEPVPVVAPPEPPTPDHIVDVNKKVSPKPENIPEGTLYLRTDDDQAKYEVIREAARIMRINVGDMSMTAIRYYVDHFLSAKLDELKALDEKKKQIIAGVTT